MCLNLKWRGSVDLKQFVILIFFFETEKMPVLKAEASHYNADLNNLLFCCQCVDVVFYSPDLKEVAEAHKIVLCAVSHVFMLLFSVKSPADIQDSSIIQTTQDLFTINRDPAFPGASQESPGNPPLRVIVKDAFFCSCLSDILRFIYSGTLSNGSGTASWAFEMKCAPGLHVLPVGFIFLFFVLSEVKIVNAIVSALSTGTGPSFLSLQVSLP